MAKLAFIVCQLVPDPSVYEGKTNADIEKEILDEMLLLPYVASVEKVMVADCSG